MTINPQIQQFAEFYCYGPTKGNGKRSAMAAGALEDEANNRAKEWLSNSFVVNFVTRYKQTAAEKLGLDTLWVLERFRDEFENCTRWRHYRDRKGNPVFVPHPDPERAAAGEKVAAFTMPDPKAAAKFGEMIAKHLKMLTDKVETTNGANNPHQQPEPITPEDAARSYQSFMDSLK